MTLIVVGTGTDVGKTITSAVIVARYGADLPLAYWKPVATGGGASPAAPGSLASDAPAAAAGEDPLRDTATVAALAGGRAVILPETYLFPEPLSPHLAARLAGGRIEPAVLLEDFARHLGAGRGLIVETAGGVLVPLTDGAGGGAGLLQIDLVAAMARRASLACLVVAHSGLGTINHTLLTLAALRARGLTVAGVVLRGPRNPENRLAIQRWGGIDAVLDLPPISPLDRPTLAAAATAFDPDGLLAPWLQPAPPLPAPDGADLGEAGDRAPSWVDDDRLHVWHPYTQMLAAPAPLPVVRAQGVYLYTADGRRLLDGISSWWVNIHGHNHPRLNRALAEQVERLQQVIFAGLTHEPAARLAAALAARVPGRLPWVFYSDDGSTAVEVALKMTYQHWRHRGEAARTLFVAFDDAYHGDTFGAMAAGGVAAFHETFRDLFFTVRRAQTPYSAAHGSTSPPLADLLASEGQRVAAVILEPMIQAAGGMLLQTPAFLRQVRQLTRQHDVPLIADEIFTGFGRTGRLFACEHGPIEPDLLCVSKALTGGYLPLAATLASDPIYRSFLSADRSRTFFHGHSFTGNALACAVALESLALFEEEDRLERIARLEALFGRRLAALEGHPAVTVVRNLGGMAALELAPAGGGGYLDRLGPELARRFVERGLLLRPLGNVLYLLPPYVISDDEAAAAFDTIAAVLDQL